MPPDVLFIPLHCLPYHSHVTFTQFSLPTQRERQYTQRDERREAGHENKDQAKDTRRDAKGPRAVRAIRD